ncbi:MAG: hypothetical protein MN733_30720, partial [Nitrososphaera sp.]|nr:hypothetical protein [Nitrososphaera sp.]
DTTGQRLQQFLGSKVEQVSSLPQQEAPVGVESAIKKEDAGRRIALIAGVCSALLLLASLLYFWVRSLQLENRQLELAVNQRDSIISQWKKEGEKLQQQLSEARLYLAETAGEVARLDLQAQTFGMAVDRLNSDVERFQDSYVQIRREREQLMERVVALEQERAFLSEKLSSVDQLQLAIREAVEVRKQAEETKRLLRMNAKRLEEGKRLAEEQQWLLDGNRGFVVRDGSPTLGIPSESADNSKLLIRVHDPEASP